MVKSEKGYPELAIDNLKNQNTKQKGQHKLYHYELCQGYIYILAFSPIPFSMVMYKYELNGFALGVTGLHHFSFASHVL